MLQGYRKKVKYQKNVQTPIASNMKKANYQEYVSDKEHQKFKLPRILCEKK